MKKNLKLICAGILAGAMCSFATAENWFVCLGSYKIKNNAEIFQKEMKADKVKSFIYECEIGGATYYRVLLDEKFDLIQEARNKAEEFGSSAVAEKNGLRGLWVCYAEKSDDSSYDSFDVLEEVDEDKINDKSEEVKKDDSVDYADFVPELVADEEKPESKILETKSIPDMLIEELAEPEEYEAFSFDESNLDSDIESDID